MNISWNTIDEFARNLWEAHQVYKTTEQDDKPKYYVLDMFPYPSGSGLHVGHPLGYVASDIYARFRRLQGYNVLHPMGLDSFGLPAEQYAIETNKHPRDTTKENIKIFKGQLEKIGLSFDWSREIVTSEPNYYKWTQWLFLQLFDSIYCVQNKRAYPISVLINHFESHGNIDNTAYTQEEVEAFSALDWKNYSEKEKADILMKYRLAYTAMGEVNWCEALGTVLANDEVINGRSERGNFPVVKRKMRQWSLRITAYADRLLEGLADVDFPASLKEQQKNWIGKSQGAKLYFSIEDKTHKIDVFTTRPDTIFGVSFMVLAPEHPLVSELTKPDHVDEILAYIAYCQAKSDVDRQAEKEVTGAFTGTFALHPLTQKRIPIYISEYVLMGYGSGAIMAVPSEDQRDRRFAEKFMIEIPEIFDKTQVENPEIGDKKGVYIASDFLNGLTYQEALPKVFEKIADLGIGDATTQYKLKDANFSRQRYWGEPIPILWKDDIAYPVPFEDLPVKNPEVDSFLPSQEGLAPNSRNQTWVNEVQGYTRELDTLPGFAGSSWYFLRYMDPKNDEVFVSKEAESYWGQVDLYLGGSEHAVGHLLYARFFNHFLYDRGYVSHSEPFKKLINQGMIQGKSQFVYRDNANPNHFISHGLLPKFPDTTRIHVDISLVKDNVLDLEGFKKWRTEYQNATFTLEEGQYICGSEVEKMSKSKYNVINPDDIIAEYGADIFRMYEMFLGPIELSKPWITKGIDGVYKFLRRFYHLFYDEQDAWIVTEEVPSDEEYRALHLMLKKIAQDIDKFSMNTCVSQYMICVNELYQLKTHKRAILEPFLVALCPFAPHLTEYLWQKLGHTTSITQAKWVVHDEKYLITKNINIAVAINGKTKVVLEMPKDISQEQAIKIAESHEHFGKQIKEMSVKKVIYVSGKMLNFVV
ncbi:MAG: leucine--tRNA ligase [Chitinophagales bacterium]|nr:leucine--tRNA ligase [Chitinophagales bacterium]